MINGQSMNTIDHRDVSFVSLTRHSFGMTERKEISWKIKHWQAQSLSWETLTDASTEFDLLFSLQLLLMSISFYRRLPEQRRKKLRRWISSRSKPILFSCSSHLLQPSTFFPERRRKENDDSSLTHSTVFYHKCERLVYKVMRREKTTRGFFLSNFHLEQSSLKEKKTTFHFLCLTKMLTIDFFSPRLIHTFSWTDWWWNKAEDNERKEKGKAKVIANHQSGIISTWILSLSLTRKRLRRSSSSVLPGHNHSSISQLEKTRGGMIFSEIVDQTTF